MAEGQQDDSLITVVEVDDEDHTLGNILRDAMWKHPHVTVANYSQQDPNGANQLLIQCQTSSAISAEQGVVESLVIVKDMFKALKDEMDAAVQKMDDR